MAFLRALPTSVVKQIKMTHNVLVVLFDMFHFDLQSHCSVNCFSSGLGDLSVD